MGTANSEDQGVTETVELPEPEEGGGESAASAEPERGTEPGKQSRKERRASEFQQAREEARAAREEAARERSEREALARQVAELNGRFQESQRQQQQNQKDPYADKIAALEDEAHLILEKVSNSKDPAEQRKLMASYNTKMREAAKLDFRRDMETQQRENPQQQQTGPDPREVALWTALEADYPTLSDKGKTGAAFRARADLHVNTLLAEGKPDNLATLRAACALAAKDLKIGGGDGKSSERQRAAFGGYANGEGAGGKGDGGRPSIPFGKHEAALAQALANRIGKGASGDDAKKAWLERVGPGVARRLSEDE